MDIYLCTLLTTRKVKIHTQNIINGCCPPLFLEEIITNIVMNVFKNGDPLKIIGTLEKYPTYDTDIISYQEHCGIWKVA